MGLGLWSGAFWLFLGQGCLHKHRRITLGKQALPLDLASHPPLFLLLSLGPVGLL